LVNHGLLPHVHPLFTTPNLIGFRGPVNLQVHTKFACETTRLDLVKKKGLNPKTPKNPNIQKKTKMGGPERVNVKWVSEGASALQVPV